MFKKLLDGPDKGPGGPGGITLHKAQEDTGPEHRCQEATVPMSLDTWRDQITNCTDKKILKCSFKWKGARGLI